MFSHVLFALGEGRREALLDEARRERLARANRVITRNRKRRLARAALWLGHSLVALGERLHGDDEAGVPLQSS
ncbi:MAG: hypothetical protein ACRENA_16685 [Vulcanimicrobiaceae bacterium]